MTIRNKMQTVHPGEVLQDEIEALEMSASAFAAALDVPKTYELRFAEIEFGAIIKCSVKPRAA